MRANLGWMLTGALAASACGGSSGPAPLEVALKKGDGSDAGRVTLRQKGDHVEVEVHAVGLAAGRHGIHLHAVAKCDGPAFTTAGGHLNPAGKKHGHQNPAGPHLGDLGNLTAGADGRAQATQSVPATTLAKLLGTAGVAVVIHAAADDEKTDPSGNSGARIACAAVPR